MSASNVFVLARKRVEKLAAEHTEVEDVFDHIDWLPPATCLTMLQDCVAEISVVGAYQELITVR